MWNKNKNAGACRSKLWIAIAYVMLAVALIGCLICTVLIVGQMKNRDWTLANGFGSKTDRIRIYIDQGHNPAPYHNSGAEGNGLYEQDLTFHIGCLLADQLKKDGRFEVCLSRPDENTVLGTDNTSSLQARVDGATDFHADYFISLHINSFSESTVKGIEVFSATGYTESYDFGNSLLQGLEDSTGLKNRGMKLNPSLYVLKHATMPAVLLEMGFISNSEDAALLCEQPELFVQGIYDGILNYFERIYILKVCTLIGLIGVVSVIFFIAGFVLMKKYNLKQTRTSVENMDGDDSAQESERIS